LVKVTPGNVNLVLAEDETIPSLCLLWRRKHFL